GMRREQPLPHGLRGLLGNLYAAGAAPDFSVLYPTGRLIDAPLPAWSHRRLLLSCAGQDSRAHGASMVPAHPLMGAHVRLQEEPERHVWQGEVGIATQPWLADHQIHDATVLPAAVHCEMALAAARTVLGEASEVRDVRFEQMLLVGDETPIAVTATVEVPGVVPFTVETTQHGERARKASAVLHAAEDDDQPAPQNVADLLASHPNRVDGADIRQWMDERGRRRFGPAFTGLASVFTAEGTGDTMLAEVSVPGPIRTQQGAYGVHPSLLDACFQSVAVHPGIRNASNGGRLMPLGVRRLRAYGSARHARYCHTTVTACGSGIEADLDVLDENGTVLLAARGLQIGTGTSDTSERDRVLNERLLTIEWQQRELPEQSHAEPGTWLLISTSDAADLVATELTDALKLHDTQCTTTNWPRHADHAAQAERLLAQLEADAFTGVVVLTAPQNGTPDEQSPVRAGEYVKHVVRIARVLTESLGQAPRLYVVTRNAQTVLADDRANLEQGGLRGLLRVISAEHPLMKVTHIDVDEHTGAEQVARQLLLGSEEDETAWRNDEWYTARMSLTPLRPEERQTTVVDHERHGMRLNIRTPGDLQTLEFAAFDRVPPAAGEIEVAVAASSINFADVLVAFGRYPSIDGQMPALGMDFAGVVTAVGPGVTSHRVGDHVGGFSKNGCWATFVTCDARLAVTLPPGLTDDAAAAVSTAHAAAWYGLHDQARIAAGDKVLIHSATGGVGQAAIAIARAAGAEIFATAGSEKRRQMLRDMGIEHVYDSRSVEFAEQIRRDTDGYGVDIVLNSLTGAAQRAGLELLAIGGRFVELGKHDVYANARLGLLPFRRNLTFHYVDLALMAASHPQRISNVLSTVYRLVADGELPVPEVAHYPLGDAATAIRAMSAAEHTGKLVLDVPHEGQSTVVVPPEQVSAFRSDGSYIVTGGLGGLGLFIAEKMASAGAGRIVLTSRSQPNPKALETIELIRAMGADIAVECGDIADVGTAERLVTVATATGVPLRGVVHAAAVFENAMLTNMTDELLDHNWIPKVHGAWNLHQATANQPLDWFCMFSSAVALLGSPGQGAYAAANSWLDAFTHWRRAQGLPAISIGWALWADVGRAATIRAEIGEDEALEEGGEGTAFAHWRDTAITADEGDYAFQALLRHDRAYTGYAPMIPSPWLTAFAQRSPLAQMFQSTGLNRSGTSRFLAELSELPIEEWPTRIRRLVAEQVGLILRRTIDIDRPLTEYGLDSLSSQELRAHMEAETGIRITATDINSTVRGLADLLYAKLAPDAGAPAPSQNE
ncbi:SDR family NAD(P)-dependent oxidoreductase, partial [Mycobacterium lacus]